MERDVNKLTKSVRELTKDRERHCETEDCTGLVVWHGHRWTTEACHSKNCIG